MLFSRQAGIAGFVVNRRSGRLFGIVLVAVAFASAVSVTTSARAARWSVQRIAAPRKAGVTLYSVSCPSARMCIAVGGPDMANRAQLFAERWLGKRWTLQRTPVPKHTRHSGLNDVLCLTARDCFAVGYFDQKALAEHWNGRSWSLQPVPRPPGATDSPLFGVSCPASNDCLAVGGWTDQSGDHRYPLLERWNGSGWSLQPSPPAPSSWADLRDISCTAGVRCTAVGFDGSGPVGAAFIDGWDGSQWSVVQGTGNVVYSRSLFRISCLPETFCAAVGYEDDSNSNGSYPDYALTEIRSGTGWHVSNQFDPRGSESYRLYGLSCASPTMCLAVGDVADHWNGRRWSVEQIPFAANELVGVDCRTATSCEVVGSVLQPVREVPLAARWTG